MSSPSIPVATVTSIEGEVLARDAGGNTRVLQQGDVIGVGEEVVTSPGGRVSLDMPNGETLSVGDGQAVAITDPMLDPTVETVLAALEGEGDLLEALDPAAAGAGAGAGEGEGGSGFVSLERLDVAPGESPEYSFAGAETETAILSEDVLPAEEPALVGDDDDEPTIGDDDDDEPPVGDDDDDEPPVGDDDDDEPPVGDDDDDEPPVGDDDDDEPPIGDDDDDEPPIGDDDDDDEPPIGDDDDDEPPIGDDDDDDDEPPIGDDDDDDDGSIDATIHAGSGAGFNAWLANGNLTQFNAILVEHDDGYGVDQTGGPGARTNGVDNHEMLLFALHDDAAEISLTINGLGDSVGGEIYFFDAERNELHRMTIDEAGDYGWSTDEGNIAYVLVSGTASENHDGFYVQFDAWSDVYSESASLLGDAYESDTVVDDPDLDIE